MREKARKAIEAVDLAVEHWDAARSATLVGPATAADMRRLWAAVRALHVTTTQALMALPAEADRARAARVRKQ